MKTKEQVQEWFSERVAIDKESADKIITILNAWDINGVYIRYLTVGCMCEAVTISEFIDWFHGELELKSVTESTSSLVTEIAELQRQIDERDRLLEHIFFVLNGDVTRRIMRTDVPLAAQIVDLLVEWQIKNKKHSAPQSGL
jgi:hypothetical protein